MRDVYGSLERERDSSSVQAATYVWLSGGPCIHTDERLLLALNIAILSQKLSMTSK